MSVILPQSLQQDVQGSLPVIPNNGNPSGAYNVAAAEPSAPQAAPVDPYAWLKPSAYMDEVNKVLQDQNGILDMALASLLSPTIEAQGFNVKAKDRWKLEPVDDLGLPIPSATGGTYEYNLPMQGENLPPLPSGV